MFLALFLPILLISSYADANITLEVESNKNLITCVTGIIKQYYSRKITYVDVNYDSNEIIKIINTIPGSYLSRDARKSLSLFNFVYVIAAGGAKEFTRRFPVLVKEPSWNPFAFFMIIVRYLNPAELPSIFDLLLKFHVSNVIVINGNNDADVYTYNPYDNYNCGKKYDNIMELGKCLSARENNFYPIKLVTGLRNCTFKATTSHWPPYAIDPKISKDSMMGAEQYVLEIIRELEHFKVEYTESINGEEFSTIAENMSPISNSFMFQEKQADIIFGGMMLLHFRADDFDFIYGHLPFMDDIRIFVKKADIVPNWKNIYLEFQTSVWLVLIVTFLVYFILIVVVLRVNDKSSLFLAMIDLFFLHGSKMISRFRGIFIIWVFFAYLISAYYQSSLVSISANPNKNYQISTDQDLIDYKYEPCVSIAIQRYLNVVLNESLDLMYKSYCNGLLESIHTVSTSSQMFTISLSSIYSYNRHLFFNEQGEDPIYAFKHPMNSVIYAFYFYKGFPLQRKLHMYTIRLRENGLIDQYLKQLYEFRDKTFVNTTRSSDDQRKHKIIFPWFILLVGSVFATGVLILEIIYKKNAGMFHIRK